MDESDALITPAEKAELKTTEPYVEGLKVLNKADQGKVLSFQEYVDARDLLITIFSIDNATRPGPLDNATLKDYETARTEQGNRIMLERGSCHSGYDTGTAASDGNIRQKDTTSVCAPMRDPSLSDKRGQAISRRDYWAKDTDFLCKNLVKNR